ncbi:MAG: hypothetical protein AUJ25_00775 [Parcubacteria group bacterium CG1_02_37_13]|nr:MAG: hypothetical protein AUJ25_00775 [Parcubacteria group bacterium CG1_02_37_13]
MEQAIKQQIKRITLRKANQEDAKFLFDLRNNPNLFKYYKSPRPVEEKEHLTWLEKVFSGEAKKYLFILEFEGETAGQLRIDEFRESKAEINIALQEGFQGKGLGTLALQEGVKLAKQLGFKELIAEIHQDNLASLKLFQKACFSFNKAQAPWQTFILKI